MTAASALLPPLLAARAICASGLPAPSCRPASSAKAQCLNKGSHYQRPDPSIIQSTLQQHVGCVCCDCTRFPWDSHSPAARGRPPHAGPGSRPPARGWAPAEPSRACAGRRCVAATARDKRAGRQACGRLRELGEVGRFGGGPCKLLGYAGPRESMHWRGQLRAGVCKALAWELKSERASLPSPQRGRAPAGGPAPPLATAAGCTALQGWAEQCPSSCESMHFALFELQLPWHKQLAQCSQRGT